MLDKEIRDILDKLSILHLREIELKTELEQRLLRTSDNDDSESATFSTPHRSSTTPIEIVQIPNTKLSANAFVRDGEAKDRHGTTIRVGKYVRVLTKGKSKCEGGIVQKVNKKRTSFVASDGRVYYRNHKNLEVRN